MTVNQDQPKALSVEKPDKNNVTKVFGGALIKAIALCLLFAALYLLASFFRETIKFEDFKRFVESTGIWAPVVYMCSYLIAPTIFFPASVLTMTGGALFGPFWGTIYTIISATLGATVPFLITRKMGRSAIDKLASRNKGFDDYFENFQNNVATQGWKYVAFTRLVTIFPFLLLNYAFGLTRISTWTYMWASFVFMLPGSFMFNYIGYAGREALMGSEDIVGKISIAAGCIILITALPTLVKTLAERNKSNKGE